MARLDQGHVVVSVDSVGTRSGDPLSIQRQALDNSRQLLQRLNRHGLKATWALTDPAKSRYLGVLAEAKLPQEVALVGDRDWVGSAAGRTRFAQELQRRVAAARHAGQDVQTLVLDDVTLEDGFDLLVKTRISVVRQDSAHRVRGARLADAFRPRSLRFGIWQAPPAFHLAQSNAWYRRPASTLKRLVRNAVEDHQVGHVVIDLERLTPRDLGVLDSWFASLAKRQSQHQLRVRTLGELGACLNQPARHRPSQSILRRAA